MNGLIMFGIHSALAQDIDASFFVYADGRYDLSIQIPGTWHEAELVTPLAPPIAIEDWPDEGLHLQGTLTDVPDHVWITLKLEHENNGKDLAFAVPTVLVPNSMPKLKGNKSIELPQMSLKWRLQLMLSRLFSWGAKNRD